MNDPMEEIFNGTPDGIDEEELQGDASSGAVNEQQLEEQEQEELQTQACW